MDENFNGQKHHPKIMGVIKREHIISENSMAKTSKSLGDHWVKTFEIFRGPSIRTDILPKYSVTLDAPDQSKVN